MMKLKSGRSKKISEISGEPCQQNFFQGVEQGGVKPPPFYASGAFFAGTKDVDRDFLQKLIDILIDSSIVSKWELKSS